MIAYIDSSVVLRVLFGQSSALEEWAHLDRAMSSELIRVEGLRALDRLRIRGQLDEQAVGRRRASLLETLEAIELVPLDDWILDRAGDPFPTTLGTLDALHLASALAVRPEIPSLHFATHDEELGLAARAMGFMVIGVAS